MQLPGNNPSISFALLYSVYWSDLVNCASQHTHIHVVKLLHCMYLVCSSLIAASMVLCHHGMSDADGCSKHVLTKSLQQLFVRWSCQHGSWLIIIIQRTAIFTSTCRNNCLNNCLNFVLTMRLTKGRDKPWLTRYIVQVKQICTSCCQARISVSIRILA